MPDDFVRLMAQLDYSLLIVTVASGEERAGCLVGFASQVSIHPPRFLVGLSVKNRTYRVASAGAEVLVVHFVPEHAEELAELFGGDHADQVHKFARCRWRPGPDGTPVLTELEDWSAGRVLERSPCCEHEGFRLEPIDGQTHRSGSPLTFRRAKRIEPGHNPYILGLR